MGLFKPALAQLFVRTCVLSVTILGISGCNFLEKNKQTLKPNFIIIFTDDQGYNDLGCYGSATISTPNIDNLASEGMRFTSFYAQPICGPSRAALMTGCYPLRVAERDNIKRLHPALHSGEITIAELLGQGGYATGCFGKWDLAGHSQENFFPELMPNHQGFDYFFGTPTSNDQRVRLFRNEECIEENADMALLTQQYTDEAIEFMDNNKDAPFFIYIPYTMPHTKLAASENFLGSSVRGLYGDVIREIDHNVGKIISKVNELKLEDRTWIFYLSDNGPWLIKNDGWVQGSLPGHHGGSAYPLRSGKVSTWEGGVRIPAIAWSPENIPGGKVCSQLCTTMDLFPTIAHIANLPLPIDRIIDGENILPLLLGKHSEKYDQRSYFYYFTTHLQAVRKGNWKLHLARPQHPEWLGDFAINRHIDPKDDIGFEKPMLVNLETDPSETTNLYDAYPEIVQELLLLAEKARSEIGDYNTLGSQARFFEDLPRRPETK